MAVPTQMPRDGWLSPPAATSGIAMGGPCLLGQETQCHLPLPGQAPGAEDEGMDQEGLSGGEIEIIYIISP